MRTLRTAPPHPPPAARAAHGGAGPSARRPPCAAARHRPPRRLRLPPRAHARVVPSWRRAWAPTTSSPTSSPPRTACSSPATRTRSAAPPTSPTTPSSPAARPPRSIDGVTVTGWFTEDFTLAELKTLRAKERHPADPPGQHALRRPVRDPDVRRGARPRARLSTQARTATIGVYPETKHPTYFRSIGLPLEPPLVQHAHAQRPRPPRRAGVRAVVRDRQPAGARPRAEGAARAAARRARA